MTDRSNLLRTLVALLSLPTLAVAQGYANLGSEAEGFAVPSPNGTLSFPADHAAHPDYRIEWWYLTSNLRTNSGEDLGIQWTLFRSALAPDNAEGWQNPQIWMGHAAVTTEDDHLFAERIARGGIGQAGARTAPFSAWIDDWEMSSTDATLDRLRLKARADAFSYDLQLNAHGPLVLHGEQGYSVKSADGQASFYYAQPAYSVTGTVTLPDGPVEVTGDAWLDREWSSQPLAPDQDGWDWFSLRFDDDTKLMGFVLRGARGDFTSGTWISAEGEAEPLAPGQFAAVPQRWSDVGGRDIPTAWRVSLPARDLSVTVEALNPQAWMGTTFSYWEGPVRVTGSHDGTGYLEMTGYGD
ncbi:lipocalin-like domain-containing protein [Tritonibacter scottomollicae]|uniref:Lipocalin-like domain-containing protein n=1 Tax=Tritonibacter scottomollicae TaxID=483013 RepID=A0ABZ0HK52_TRISK|nr:lipocalin-like domain-containing protein [Tritonibacter scottomollicae]WOI34276.1 lipocalin-like domain-containing protein [Tritonibacter scottomollicae]